MTNPPCALFVDPPLTDDPSPPALVSLPPLTEAPKPLAM